MSGGDTRSREGGGESSVRRESAIELDRTPPLELYERGGKWVLAEYDATERGGSTISTDDTRIGGLRAGRTRMDGDSYPCLLRWNAGDRVENCYWNPLYERLEVRYDELLGVWTVMPESGYVRFETAVEKPRACTLARSVQHEYHFKHLDVFSPDGERQQVVDHRFVENPPTAPDRSAADSPSGATATDDTDSPTPAAADVDTDEEPSLHSTPERVLDAAVSDLHAVTELDTTSPVHRYRATGEDDGPVTIATVAPSFTSDRTVMTAFMSVVTQWEDIADATHVTPVHDIGIGPSPWVAYPTGDGLLSAHVDDLGIRARLRIVCDLASALDTATRYNVPRRGICPTHVRLLSDGDTTRATLSDWGLESEVANALDERRVTPYTAPEQLDGETTPTTGTYQLGALTYRLLLDRVPFDDPADLADSIRTGRLTPPSEVRDLPLAVDEVFARAMDPEPRDRYTSATAFRDRLVETLQ